jgi:UDP-N-acetylmuramyl pentapeptide phosphotransferase/UDP-N-acetylglucosamine-1-phosphate transferase
VEVLLSIIKNDWLQMGFTFVFALFITAKLMPLIIEFSGKLDLVDKPNERKVHAAPIPNLGGIGIFLGYMVATIGWMVYYGGSIEAAFILYGIMTLFVMGIIDDQIDMKASIKFLIQIGVAVLIASAGTRITNLNGLFGIYEMHIVLQYGLTVLLLVGLVNAFNLIDGVNGLAGGIAFIDAIIMGVLLYNPLSILISLLAFGMAGALLGFLLFNFGTAKIFMGDTGSLIIGYILAVLGVLTIKVGTSDDGFIGDNDGLTIIVVGILILPVFDTLRVFIQRISKRKSPFSPDKTHIHHLLLDTYSEKKVTHKKVAIVLYIANILIIITAFFLKDLDASYSIPILFVIAFLFYDFRIIYDTIKLVSAGKKKDKIKSKIIEENVLLDDD